MIVDGTQVTQDLDPRFDVVVIGTGAGGAVVGKELAERGAKVAFVEEGRQHKPESHRDLGSQAVARMYRNQGLTLVLGNPVFPVLYGSALGGTTVINSGTCFRMPEQVHEKWVKEHGLGELTSSELAPHYARVEKEIHVEPSRLEVMSRANTITMESLAKQGIASAPLNRNVKNCEGCGMCCYGCTSAAKQAMDVSYIPKAFRAGATAYTSARVTRIFKKSGRVLGVEAQLLGTDGQPTGRMLRLQADITIVATGTVNTPILLETNGLGRSPHLGKNLTVHPATKMYAEFEEEIYGWRGTPQAAGCEALHHEGILFEGLFMPPDLAASMNPFSGKASHEFMRAYRHMATFGFMIEDSQTGSVQNLPIIGPVIRYNLSQDDANRMQRATGFLADVFLKNGSKRVIPMVKNRIREIRNEKDLRAYLDCRVKPGDIEAAAFHPLGTSRIGRDARRGVIDTDCKVFGVDGLYVCDGSIMPSALGVNPQLTIMAFADRLASHLAVKRD